MKKLVFNFFCRTDPHPRFFSDGQILSENRILGYFRFLIDLLEYDFDAPNIIKDSLIPK